MRGPKAGRPIPPMTEADERRFWAKVALSDKNGCLTWTAGKSSNGYGMFSLGGSMYLVHRIAWTLANGPIPPDKVLDHTCRNRACANPLHLEVVDSRTNVLRGEGPSAKHAQRTHCPAGHEYTDVNTYVTSNGGRQCRICRRKQARARRASLSRAGVSTPST